ALFFVEAMLLVPISPLALTLTPTILRRRWRRLAIHGSADPLQNITRALRVRRHRTEHKSQRKSQDRPLYHLTLPSATDPKIRIHALSAVSNTAERASVPVAILLRLVMVPGCGAAPITARAPHNQ